MFNKKNKEKNPEIDLNERFKNRTGSIQRTERLYSSIPRDYIEDDFDVQLINENPVDIQINQATERHLENKQLQEEEAVHRVREAMKTRFGEKIKERKEESTFQSEVREAIDFELTKEFKVITTVEHRRQVGNRIYNLIMGLGPLEELFKNGYSEIMVTRYNKIFVEEKGKMKLSGVEFASEEELRLIIEQIFSPLGRDVNQNSPMGDGRLPDGSRVNAVLPPITPDGAELTIRRFPEKKLVAEDYIKFKSLNQTLLDFLKIAVESRWNLIVSGGTGSGKTSLLNLLSNFLEFDPGLAVMTIEDSCELRINHPNVRRYETREANSSGTGAISSRACVKNAMRSRPDAIIIGEIRDGTMADFLRLATSGHDSCMTTVHCDSPQELQNTIQVLFQMAEDYNFGESAIKRLYAAAVDIIVQIKRCSDHIRRITHISHVVGYGKEATKVLNIPYGHPDYDPDEVYIRDIFVWKSNGVDDQGYFIGDYVSTGYIPQRLIEKAEDNKVKIDRTMFQFKEDEDD